MNGVNWEGTQCHTFNQTDKMISIKYIYICLSLWTKVSADVSQKQDEQKSFFYNALIAFYKSFSGELSSSSKNFHVFTDIIKTVGRLKSDKLENGAVGFYYLKTVKFLTPLLLAV